MKRLWVEMFGTVAGAAIASGCVYSGNETVEEEVYFESRCRRAENA